MEEAGAAFLQGKVKVQWTVGSVRSILDVELLVWAVRNRKDSLIKGHWTGLAVTGSPKCLFSARHQVPGFSQRPKGPWRVQPLQLGPMDPSPHGETGVVSGGSVWARQGKPRHAASTT